MRQTRYAVHVSDDELLAKVTTMLCYCFNRPDPMASHLRKTCDGFFPSRPEPSTNRAPLLKVLPPKQSNAVDDAFRSHTPSHPGPKGYDTFPMGLTPQ